MTAQITRPPKLRINPEKTYFLTETGKPFFYLADTAWAAFSNLDLADWPRYLAQRRLQGFNALQISILPITHDASVLSGDGDPFPIAPFLKDDEGNWDFSAYNEAYFEKAETMVRLAVEQGFVPVLGVLWCSYVPGTQCAKGSPIASAMPFDQVEAYASYAAERFKKYDPMFFVSGDTCFESPDEEGYYMTALEAVQKVCPDALLTMHLHPQGELPESFLDKIDFYMYQSGHGATTQEQPYTHAEKFSAYPVKHPVLNSEPPYEGHGRVGEQTRFSAFDIRRASWQSLLAGAKMGITYGAHGIWSFHHTGMTFLNAHRSFEPFHWADALMLDGAWDVSFAKWLYETHNLFALDPVDLVQNEDAAIRAAANPDRSQLAIYTPYPFEISIDLDLSGYECTLIDLATRRICTPIVRTGPTSVIAMHLANSDTLFLATKQA